MLTVEEQAWLVKIYGQFFDYLSRLVKVEEVGLYPYGRGDELSDLLSSHSHPFNLFNRNEGYRDCQHVIQSASSSGEPGFEYCLNFKTFFQEFVMGGHSIGIIPMAISLCASFNSAYLILGKTPDMPFDFYLAFFQ